MVLSTGGGNRRWKIFIKICDPLFLQYVGICNHERKEIVSMKVEGFIEDSALDVAAKRLT